MGRLDRSYLEGMTPEDARFLMQLLEGRSIAQDLLDRFHGKGWIESSPQGHLITWAGRCVLESLRHDNSPERIVRPERILGPRARTAPAG